MPRHYGRQLGDGDPDGYDNEQKMDRSYSEKLMLKFPRVKDDMKSAPVQYRAIVIEQPAQADKLSAEERDVLDAYKKWQPK